MPTDICGCTSLGSPPTHTTRSRPSCEAKGVWVYDQHGKRYLDGLSGLFTSQIGHGRTELAEAAARQAERLAYFPIWSYAHPMAVELADRLSELTPGDCNRIFFTTGGSEAVESAWKLARQYFKVTGQPSRTKVISRNIAYHGATMGALSVTGLADIKTPFEPLVPGAVHVPNTNFYRAPYFADDLEAFGRWAADAIEQAILIEGPDTVAAVFLEPVQNAGGCFRRRRGTSPGSARSAIDTACSSSPTTSSAASGGSGTGSAAIATTTGPTWSRWPRD